MESLEYVQSLNNLGVTIKDNENEPRFYIVNIFLINTFSPISDASTI
jgi:hypothetical protein